MDRRPYVQTFSIVAGGLACNACCPFCVAKMTPNQGVKKSLPFINWRNFHLGAELAKEWGAATTLISSKGEATSWPDQITQFLYHLERHNFPMVELQTNGILLAQDSHRNHLRDWYDLGLTTIAISIVSYGSAKNKEIYQPKAKRGLDLIELIKKLHAMGFSVRLTAMMLKGFIDCPKELVRLINFCRDFKVEQLTVRPIEKPVRTDNNAVAEWVEKHTLSVDEKNTISDFLEANAKTLRKLVHGAVVCDFDGQNICLSNCLTTVPEDPDIRQIIFFPDGHVRYDWTYPGALLF